MIPKIVMVNCLPGEIPSAEQHGAVTVKSIAGDLLAITRQLPDIHRAEAVMLLDGTGIDLFRPPDGNAVTERRTLFALLGLIETRSQEDETINARAVRDEPDSTNTRVLAAAQVHNDARLALARFLSLIFSTTAHPTRTTIVALDCRRAFSSASEKHPIFMPYFHLNIEGLYNFLYAGSKRSLPELALTDTPIHQAIRRMKSARSLFFTRLPLRDCGLVCALGGDVRCGYLVGEGGDTIGIQVRAPRHTVFLVDTPNFSAADHALELRQSLLTAIGVPAPTPNDGSVLATELKPPLSATPGGPQTRRTRARSTRAKVKPQKTKPKPRTRAQPVLASAPQQPPASQHTQPQIKPPTTPDPLPAPWRITKMVLDPQEVHIQGQKEPVRVLRVHYTAVPQKPRNHTGGTLDVHLGPVALVTFVAFVQAARLLDKKSRFIHLQDAKIGRKSMPAVFPLHETNYYKPVEYIDRAFNKACKKASIPGWRIRLIETAPDDPAKGKFRLRPEFAKRISLGRLREAVTRTAQTNATDAVLLELLLLTGKR